MTDVKFSCLMFCTELNDDLIWVLNGVPIDFTVSIYSSICLPFYPTMTPPQVKQFFYKGGLTKIVTLSRTEQVN